MLYIHKMILGKEIERTEIPEDMKESSWRIQR